LIQVAALFLAGFVLFMPASACGQSRPSASTLAKARQMYVGKKVAITGPHESSSPGLLALYKNWRSAKLGADGRYHPVSEEGWSHLPFGYERHQATIIAVQVSDQQHKEKGYGVAYDFIVQFDDKAIAMCTSPLDIAAGDFTVVPAGDSAHN
jgi:hypothetical protein